MKKRMMPEDAIMAALSDKKSEVPRKMKKSKAKPMPKMKKKAKGMKPGKKAVKGDGYK